MSTGRITWVYTERLGCKVTSTVVGDDVTTEIPVDHFVVEFSETGGQFLHEPTGDIYAYAASDEEAQTITLAEPLPSGKTLAADDALYVYPLARDRWALVQVEDVEDEPPYEARIPRELWHLIPEGADAEGLRVDLAPMGEEWVITGTRASEPVVDGSYIDPGTLPDPELTDGEPPAVSPAVTVEPGILCLFVKWQAINNADPVSYDIHIGTQSEFTPGSGTLLESDYAGTMKVITALPDGTPLDPDTTYYVRVVAKDADGSADPGDEGSGQPLRLIGSTHITDESIETPQLAANSIASHHLQAAIVDAGHLAAELVLASLIKTAESGRRIEMSSAGFYGYESDESSIISIPTDGTASILNMDVIARSLLAQNGAILRGASRLTKGSALELESAVENPMVAPTVSLVWPSVLVNGGGDEIDVPARRRGLYWDADTETFWYVVYVPNGRPWVYQVDTDGDVVSSLELTQFERGDDPAGLAKVGNVWCVLSFLPQTGWWVITMDEDWDTLSFWQYTDEPAGYRPAIGTDGTNVLIARVAPNDDARIKIRAYNPMTGVQNGSTVSTDSVGSVDLFSVNVGSFDFSATRYVIGCTNRFAPKWSFVRVYNTSGQDQEDQAWLGAANGATQVGLAWDGSQWRSIAAASGRLHRYTSNTWTTQSSKWYVAYSLRDGDSTGGTHETDMSPKQAFTMEKRAAIRWSTPDIPDAGGVDDPDRVRIWVGRGNSEPADSAMWLNAEPDPGVVTGVIESASFSGTSFATGKGDDFVDAVPAEIRTVDGNPLIRANGIPRAKVNRTSSVTINGPDGQTLVWDTEVVDTDNFWESGMPARFNCPYTGHYLITLSVTWADAGNNTGRRVWVESSNDNGNTWSIMPALQSTLLAINGFPTWQNLSAMVNQTAGNQMRVRAAEHSGSTVNINNAQFAIMFLGPA